MYEQLSMLPALMDGEDIKELQEQVNVFSQYTKEKRNWENAFQRWSNSQMHNPTTSTGACGYGSMCDYCEDNSYGRPCVRALNDLCRKNKITIDYSKRNFEEIWNGKIGRIK